MKNLVIGIIAHVDAGKTTLTEGMLYSSGATDRLGRVDKRDAHLDTHSLERERGITIFSKQAIMELPDSHVTLIDTPGHVDFSCECERSLSVQDYAILVISATDGVTAHTRTLWQLLSARRIPTFIFVNKCDIADRRRDDLLAELMTQLSPHCIDFTKEGTPEFYEAVAASDVRLMDEFFESEMVATEHISEAIRRRAAFPCYFGSALKMRGVEELLSGLDKYTLPVPYPTDVFGAKIYKIDRDAQGKRIAFAKITGGTLAPKCVIEFRDKRGEEHEEKIEELRVWNGERSSPLKLATPGTVCAIYGTGMTEAGMGLGFEPNDAVILTPVLDYSLILPDGADPYEVYLKLAPLGEEDPSLGLIYNAESKEIRVSLMGDIQREVLTRVIESRFGIAVGFDEGRILYRETVADTTFGAGHFEPLRHYAEVHVRIDPMPEGTGIIAATECEPDTLALSWQRLAMTHIKERTHRGVMLGAPLTDVKITLTAGKAHLKHTSGGDFRQATYRAIRQALRKSGTVILEPTFDYRIEVPSESLGRVLTDLTNMRATMSAPDIIDGIASVEGNCPVETMRSYATTLRAFTRGAGKITMTVGKYALHRSPEELVLRVGYDPDRDERHTADSVFCKGGAGYTVPWNEADELMHLKPGASDTPEEGEESTVPQRARAIRYHGTAAEDKELERIFEATYGKSSGKKYSERSENKASVEPPKTRRKPKPLGDEYVIIDGYNVIFSWEELKPSSKIDFSLAREILIRTVCSYASFKRVRAIIVFDAHRVKDGKGSIEKYGDLTVVYTKEAQTADAYIERATYEIAPTNRVRVVTSDLAEQYIILGNGALRVSASEFRGELGAAALEMSEIADKYTRRSKS